MWKLYAALLIFLTLFASHYWYIYDYNNYLSSTDSNPIIFQLDFTDKPTLLKIFSVILIMEVKDSIVGLYISVKYIG